MTICNASAFKIEELYYLFLDKRRNKIVTFYYIFQLKEGIEASKYRHNNNN